MSFFETFTMQPMLKIAIVEDQLEDFTLLNECLTKYFNEAKIKFEITHFGDPLQFLEFGLNHFDLCFLDVEMPYMNGLELANKMRDQGDDTSIVFVTNVYSLAASGYEVDALDYILKPVKYPSLSLKMDRIVRLVRKRLGSSLVLKTKGEIRIINQSEIVYVEVSGHNLTVHTTKEDITLRYKLSDIQDSLDPSYFSKCNNCYLVNLSYISKVVDHEVFLQNGTSLQISFPRKKEFMKDISTFIRGGK